MRKKFYLKGLDCANCASKIEEHLKKEKELKKIEVNFIKKTLILELNDEMADKVIDKTKKIIKQIEPEVEIVEEIQGENLKSDLLRFLVGLGLFFVGIILNHSISSGSAIIVVLYVISYFITGGEVVLKAIKNIFKKELFDENFLMTIATIGAFIIGEYEEAVAVMLFFQLGELFQNYAVNHSRKSIANLMAIKPEYANVEEHGEITQKKPELVNVGDIIIVKPGEKVPLDGIVIKGSSFIDTVALTGESVPRKVSVADTVLSGCVNQEGVLKLKVVNLYQDSNVCKILDLVENASNRKAEAEHFITKFSKYYTPIVVGVACLLAIIPPILMNEYFSVWVYRALSFLVVSCPCALVISIPLSFFGGIGASARKGILIKGSNYLEALSQVETIFFDKTGTLTEGVFEVQEVSPINISKDKLLELVTLSEIYSNHPIASSIKKAYQKDLDKKRVQDVQELPGLGISAKIDNKEVIVGNEKLMNQEYISIKKCHKVGTVLYVAIDKEYVGYILIADKIKENSKIMIQQLKNIGVKRIGMLTGDKKEIGESIAKELEIDSVYTDLLPTDKVACMERIIQEKQRNSKVAFVGDGINDAPVLAMSDVGIVMGGMGSDAAIEAANIVIMNDNLLKLVDGIKLSKRTLNIVKQNIVFSIMIKIMVLLLSAVGVSTMWMAVFADVGVSVLAILNSLRLLRIKD